MSLDATIFDPAATVPDPLTAFERPDRAFYDTGVLLDAEDFLDEQTYHRSRLARALGYLTGAGTLAGLKAQTDLNGGVLELEVTAGLAVDRYGRLIEVPRPWCMRLQPWVSAQTNDALRAAHGATGVVADLYLVFAPAARGRTPAFAQGDFDATDALVPSRIRDAFHFSLVLRPEAKDAPTAPAFLPRGRFDAIRALAPAARVDAMRQAVLDGWTESLARPRAPGDTDAVPPLREHALGVDPASIFLARVVMPTLAGPGATPAGGRPDVDFANLNDSCINNLSRSFAVPTDLLGAVFGA
jgi:hypothetical protein